MNELIKIDVQGGKQTVNARDLHVFLEARKDFSNWIKDRIEKYGFTEYQDYVCSPVLASEGRGGQNRIDYHLSISMAKELSMVERNEKGKRARQYFIECERVALQAIPPHQIPQTLSEALRLAADLAETNSTLTKKIESDKPLVKFAETVNGTKNSISIGDFSKFLYNAGIKIGRNRLFDYLREHKYLDHMNKPYQRFVEMGIFKSEELIRETSNGPIPFPYTKITGKGQVYLAEKIVQHFKRASSLFPQPAEGQQ